MATGFSGRLILIKRGDAASPEAFTTIAALRDTTVTETEQTVDTTSKDDGGVRSLLSGRILHSVAVSGTGVFTDDQSLADLRTDMRSGAHSNYQIDIVDSATTGGEILTGAFRVTSLEFAGTFDGEANYSVSFESDGTITAS